MTNLTKLTNWMTNNNLNNNSKKQQATTQTNDKRRFYLRWNFFLDSQLFWRNKLHYGFFLASAVGKGKKEPDILDPVVSNLHMFFSIWPLSQWISSLVVLIILYIITGHYYNKWLSHAGGWLDVKTRCWLIAIDLTTNLILGLYYMNYRETTMGMIMMKCPIAVSPIIFCLELLAVYVYYKIKQKKS